MEQMVKIVKFNFFKLINGNYVVFPTGNHVEKSIIMTNEIGKEICERISTESKEEIIEMLSQKYNVSKEILFADLNEFILKLENVLNENLINESEVNVNSKSINQGLISDYYEKKNPYNVFFELTYNCNLRCPHCYLQDDLTNTSVYIDKKIVFRIIDELEELNTVNLIFTGGEATMHPDIIEILKYATGKNLLVTLLTNGQLLTDYMLEQLVDIPLYDVRVSLYGNEQQHDSFVKKSGAFRQVKKVLSFLQERKGIGQASYIVTKLNYLNFIDTMREFAHLNIPVNFSGMILPTAEGSMKPTEFRVDNREELKKVYKESGISLSGSKCTAGICRFRITPKGDLTPCEMMHHIVFGNLNTQSLFDILKDKNHNEWIDFFNNMQKNHTCNKCEANKWCTFCPGLFYEETGSYEKPSINHFK